MLMSAETEYSVAAFKSQREVPKETLHNELTAAIRKKYRYLPDANGHVAIYTENGSRLYLDAGGHPELAQPEVLSPREVAHYDKAGERLMADAARRLSAANPGMELSVVKNNIAGFAPDDASWAQHSSFMCWIPLEQAAGQILSHLVTQLPFAGAGCLSANSNGFGFELSQRARHFVKAVGSETTHDRPIFCTRIRKQLDVSTDGWVRAHMICKDSQRMSFGTYLSFATTGLIFHFMNQRRNFENRLTLADPVQSIRAVSVDPWLKTRLKLADGGEMTPLEIQFEYLEQCERFQNGGNGPDWGSEALRHWRETLETLEQNPMRLAGRLDPYMKLALFDHELARANFTWSQLRSALEQLYYMRSRFVLKAMNHLIERHHDAIPAEYQSAFAQFKSRYPNYDPDLLRFAGRMQVLEHQYHTLGGLYDQLGQAGYVERVVLTEDEIQRAITEPPQGSRAALRGQCIRQFHGSPNHVCDWEFILNTADNTSIDLRNPFETELKTLQEDQKPLTRQSILQRILG